MNYFATGNDFSRAVAAHFKLAGHKVMAGMPVETGRDEAFAVTLTIMLGPDDLVAIGNLMRGDVVKAETAPYEDAVAAGRKVVHVDVPDADDKVRFVWLDNAKCSVDQRTFSVGIDTMGPTTKYAVPINHLSTAELEGAKIETL